MHYFKNNSEKEESCFPTLSWNERLTGFAICLVFGFTLEFLSLGSFVGNLSLFIFK